MMKTYELTDGGTPGRTMSSSGNCQLCKSKDNDVIYDAKVPVYGQWAYVCRDCFDDYQCSLGIGLGQRYEVKQ